MEKMADSLNNLVAKIKTNPWEFSLHQALSLLEIAHKDKMQFGYGKRPIDEPLLLNAYCNFTAPASDCVGYSKMKNAEQLTINQTSLLGMNGVLPQYYTEMAVDELKNKKDGFVNFVNIFNQRVFGMLHKLEKRTKRNLNNAVFNSQVVDIAGLKGHDTWSKICSTFVGALWHKNKNAHILRNILHLVFGNKIEIQEFIEKWIDIDDDSKSFLNGEKMRDKVIGNRGKCRHSAIKITVYLSNLEEYNQFLPGSKKHELLKKICKYYVTPGLEVQIAVHLTETRRMHLSSAKKLGYSAWL